MTFKDKENFSEGSFATKDTVLASITFAASDFPPEEDFEFCAGDSGCDCGCGEYDGVDLDAESEAYVKAMKSQLPDASEFMKQALSGELFGYPAYDAEKERAKQAAYNEALARFDLLDPPRVYSYPLVLGYAPGGYFDTASNKWVNTPPVVAATRVHDLYVSVNGKTEVALASSYPPGTLIQSLVGNWFKGDGTMWEVTSERPTEPVEVKAAYSGPIAGDVDAIADKLKAIEPKYVTPKPPAEKLDVWAKGTARRNDGWLWRWSGVEWKKEGPAF